MSEAESPERLSAAHRPTIGDIRVLAGPATPHFAEQIAVRIARLIAPLAPDDPVRSEGERQLARLEELAHHTGEPRGRGPDPHERRAVDG